MFKAAIIDEIESDLKEAMASFETAAAIMRRSIRNAISGRLKRHKRKPKVLVYLEPAIELHSSVDAVLGSFYELLPTVSLAELDADQWETDAKAALDAHIVSMAEVLRDRANFNELMKQSVTDER